MRTVTPITLTNSQSQASPANFQQLIQVPTPQYLNGVRFWSPTDGYLYAWLESISSGTATIWVRIPSSIPANGTYQLYMIQDSTLPMDGVYWGEAPQLSSTYAQYDNGASVFTNYWNFAGTSLPSGWTVFGGYTDYSVNNGLTLTGAQQSSSGGNAGIKSNVQVSIPYILETYANYPSESTSSFFNPLSAGPGGNQQTIIITDYYGIQAYSGGSSGTVEIASSGTGIWSIIGVNASTVYGSFNYGPSVSSTSTNPVSFPTNVYSPSAEGATFTLTNPITEYYIRVRAYPPNGVMPTVSFGASQYSGELITVTVP